MGRKRNPQRDEARKLWDAGNITVTEIAEKLGKTVAQVRKWKSIDQWEGDSNTKKEKKKRGGQEGNENAKGHGAPSGNENAKGHGAPEENKNAETHGAYSTVSFENLTEEEQKYIIDLGLDVEKNLTAELRVLKAKELDLEKRIDILHKNTQATLHIERVVTVEGEEATTTTTTSASTFEQVQKLEQVLGRVQGRIIKLVDSIKTHEAEVRRADLEVRRHNLHRQKLSGAFDIDPVTGLVDDSTDGESLSEDVMEPY